MENIQCLDGQVVTEDMINSWSEALEEDRWPKGWVTVGEPLNGQPPSEVEPNVVLSVKVPASIKRAVEQRAQRKGVSTSAAARELLEDGLLALE
jgi:hypothetical protein